ncbi:serine hydrolase [Paenibacillus solisilvae]|uniref:Serine hydrolase n=1 Tax=Paenibacillus solisilvae TaxID=2486751 RepID=A0ABW0W053_9BACL
MLKRLQEVLQNIIDGGNATYGVAVYHFETDDYFFHQPDESFYAASIIKVPIMSAVFDQVEKGRISLSEKMVVRAQDMVTGSGILQNLTPNFDMSIYDLIVLMIIESDNTATNMLVDRIGIEAVQQAMREFGMTGCEFHHKLQIMPAKGETGDNLITARDITEHMKKIAQGKIVSWNACRHMIGIMKQQKFNDGLPGLLPYPEGPLGSIPKWEMAHKTGFVPGREHDAGLLYLPGHTFAVSVFGKDIKDRADAKRVMSSIGYALYDAAHAHG